MSRLTKRVHEETPEYDCNKSHPECVFKGDSEDCIYCGIYERMFGKLGIYEDAEEQGLLLHLPFKVGDPVYLIYNILRIEDSEVVHEVRRVYVKRFEYNHLHNLTIVCDRSLDGMAGRSHEIRCFKGDIGKSMFLTLAEAEAALQAMKEGRQWKKY